MEGPIMRSLGMLLVSLSTETSDTPTHVEQRVDGLSVRLCSEPFRFHDGVESVGVHPLS